MMGLVLGLGFQWWPELDQPWQYIAFIFIYLDVVDYWIEYSPTLKKWPPKREIDVMLDIAIMFSMFLYIYSTTQPTIIYLLVSAMLVKTLDYFWLLSSKIEFHPVGIDKVYMDTWLRLDIVIVATTAVILFLSYFLLLPPLQTLFIYIITRLSLRIIASLAYGKVHYT